MQEKFIPPKAGFWKRMMHNLRVIYVVLTYRKMYAMYGKIEKEYPGGEGAIGTAKSLEIIGDIAHTLGIGENRQFALHIGVAMTAITFTVLSSPGPENERLSHIIGIALELRQTGSHDDFLKGLALREVKTFWGVVEWLAWAGFIDENFFKARFAGATAAELEGLKTTRIGEVAPKWLEKPLPGLELPSLK